MLAKKPFEQLTPQTRKNNSDDKFAPCCGCGYCCQQALCGYGAYVHGHRAGPCPALVWQGDRFRCQVYLDADEDHRRLMEIELGIGFGCSSSLCNTQREAQLRRLSAAEEGL